MPDESGSLQDMGTFTKAVVAAIEGIEKEGKNPTPIRVIVEQTNDFTATLSVEVGEGDSSQWFLIHIGEI